MSVRRAREFESIIADGGQPVGAFVTSVDPSSTLIYGALGYDWVLIDREHGMIDIPAMVAHLRTAEAYGLVPFVRVLGNDPTLIQQALDAGAQGILVPKVGSAAEARRAVAAGRYASGGRGMCPVVPAMEFSGAAWEKRRQVANDNVIVMPLIETKSGVDNIEEIVSVEGVDYIFFGLADLSQDLGLDMVADLPTIVEMWEYVAETAHRHGVRAGAPLGYGFDPLADFGSLVTDLMQLQMAAEKALQDHRLSRVHAPEI
ncbi:HpcH/HpaI aldolase family protein [Rhodococcus sp. T7]|uniref:HpcH/HpaI aldolase family protein n=1 Tax=Rhodococcus sp. T7 TaxID=627444 RepID=UPI001356E8E0|nr:aldolase/citrate lyase family protein [Rhodococcus sp. T7]KAF0957987.1 5-keto-4-deoxy-D-glucarate aldolase [Rhodococcus sp. T7]KAF0960146.1 5-keto-4-deoxy-D-glucarate aldolase [Rhodococcus sp. T7]